MNELVILLLPKISSTRNLFFTHSRLALLALLMISVCVAYGIYYGADYFAKKIGEFYFFGDLLKRHLLSLLFFSLMVLIFLSSVITGLSTYFTHRDLELLFTLPTSRSGIFLFKLVETAMTSAVVPVLFFLPVVYAFMKDYGSRSMLFAGMAAVIPVFLIIPCALGVFVTLVLGNLLPVKKTQRLLQILGVLFLSAIIILFRILRPERLVDQNELKNLTDFLASLRNPVFYSTPSQWALDVIYSLVSMEFYDALLSFLLLATSAFVLLIAVTIPGTYLHYRAYQRFLETSGAVLKNRFSIFNFLDYLVSPLPRGLRALVSKDFRIFLRDQTIMTQLMMLAAVVVIYAYNLQLIPFDSLGHSARYVRQLIAFLNTGLIGFLGTATAVRFIYPAVSIEGKNLGLLKSVPLKFSSYMWTKFVLFAIALSIFDFSLAFISTAILQVDPFLSRVAWLDSILLSVGITAIALGFGALYPNLKADSISDMPASFGGLAVMFSAMLYVLAVLLAEAYPLMLYYAMKRGYPVAPYQVWIAGALLSGIVILSFVAVYVPMKLGLRRLEGDIEY